MIIWVDTETTGFDASRGDLLEVALVVTRDNLAEVAATSVVVQPDMPHGFARWRERLDPDIQDMHGKNGLLEAIERGEAVGLREAEVSLFAWVTTLDRRPYMDFFDLKKTPLAGSTVGFDRTWLCRHMPMLESLFSYRSIDVTSFTEIAKRWAPTVYDGRPRASAIAHRALADIRESINYLRYYRESGFIGGAKQLSNCDTELPRVTAKKTPKNRTGVFQPYTVDCPYCASEHHHGGAGQRRADCARGEYIVEIGGGQ